MIPSKFELMNRTFFIVALLVGLALGLSVLVGAAYYFIRLQNGESHAAQNTPAENDPVDDRPGSVSGAETRPNARAAKFEALDLDKDGVLSPIEFAGTRKPAEAEKWFKRRDVNHDGFISREEFLPFSAGPGNP